MSCRLEGLALQGVWFTEIASSVAMEWATDAVDGGEKAPGS